jgi:hypothetical protein
MALAYNNVYKNCTADEFVLNKKRVGKLLRSGFVIILSPH